MATKMKASQRGIKAILASEIRELPPILINGLLPSGGGLILAGESEVGKSLMRLEISILLSIGLPVYGMKTPHAQTIAIFQTENSLKVEQYRMRQILAGHGIEEHQVPDRIFYAPRERVTSLKDGGFQKKAKAFIEEVGATLCIWDPLTSYHNENENANVPMRSVLDKITWLNRETGAASIVIHHFGQPGKKGEDIPLRYRMRGASAIRDWADTVITLRHTGTEDNPGPGRVLDYVKIRNGPGRPPLHLERNKYFVHELSQEDRKAPLEIVKDIARDHGKAIKTQNELVKMVQLRADCSRGSAFNAIKECLELGYIWRLKVDGIEQGYGATK